MRRRAKPNSLRSKRDCAIVTIVGQVPEGDVYGHDRLTSVTVFDLRVERLKAHRDKIVLRQSRIEVGEEIWSSAQPVSTLEMGHLTVDS